MTAVFPAYLNCLYKKGVHVLTFNDYLAKRDALWMKPIYDLLGVTVAFVQETMNNQEKKEAYSKDITYVTAKEAGFDYLRDSLTYDKKDLIHRNFYLAIVDEADSILIDEARVPLEIASKTKEVSSNLQRDVDYIVRNKRIEMVDEFTGRVAENRHWPDGVQAALECKEGLEIQSKGRIMTQISLQHFIKQYENLAGMTGTAVDSADEFYEVYDMDLVIIPANVKSQRIDCPPYVFTHKEAKYKALVEEIKRVHSTYRH